MTAPTTLKHLSRPLKISRGFWTLKRTEWSILYIAKQDLESEMTVVRNEWEAGENSPADVLFERVTATAYLWNNYGKAIIGARADIEKVPIERLQPFYRKHHQPDNAFLVIACRFDEGKALELVNETLGSIAKPDGSGYSKSVEWEKSRWEC